MTASNRITLEKIMVIKSRYEVELLRIPNVIGVGIGLAEPDPAAPGEQEPTIVITVKEPVPPATLPSELDGVPVRIMTVGTVRGLEK